MPPRIGTYSRTTGETDVSVTIGLDGTGESSISTGNGMLDHLLNQLSRHGLIDLEVTATGDSALTGWHHTVEDTGIALGRALANAVGDGAGIRRMGHALVPLDEALARVALDISGRGYAAIDLGIGDTLVGDLPGDLVRHFLQSFATEARVTLHVTVSPASTRTTRPRRRSRRSPKRCATPSSSTPALQRQRRARRGQSPGSRPARPSPLRQPPLRRTR